MKAVMMFAISAVFVCGTAISQIRTSDAGQSKTVNNFKTSDDLNSLKSGAEAEEYAAAMNEANPARKAARLETFVVKHPESAMMPNAFEQTLEAYKGLNREQFQELTELDRPATNAETVPALALVVFWERMRAPSLDPKSPVMGKSCLRAQTGIQALSEWQKPSSLSLDQYYKVRNKAEAIFNAMAGYCEFVKQEYVAARGYYLRSLEFDANNIDTLNELAFVDLEMNPIDVTGFWYIARAKHLRILKEGPHATVGDYPYGESKYVYYHGSRDGWDEILKQAATQPAPPPGFTVTPSERSKRVAK